MSAEFERLIVEPLSIHDGENGFVIRNKIKRKMDRLIKNHNDLVRIIHRNLEEYRGYIFHRNVAVVGHDPKWLKGQWINSEHTIQEDGFCSCGVLCDKTVRLTNKPGDVIDLLIQMRYICQCVAATIVKLPVSTHPWCADCNRPNLDHEKEETNAY